MYSIKKYPLWESTMFEEEIDVLLSVLRDTLSDFTGNGAFILTSQRSGTTHEERILSFGVGENRDYAEEEMKRLEKAIRCYVPTPTVELENRIDWIDDNQPILVLHATYGWFICGFFSDDPDFSVGMLAATAKTLTRLCNEDGCLRGSCGEIHWHEYADELPIITKRVAEVFDIHKTNAIKEWEKWRKFTQIREPFFT